ncbi:MAG: SDR family NAD(P)-dependent oxidoreductase [Myxococcales bacterium]|nr:SDR family NAD(P)-dependent oxidoreductase [Myxococcales bacterium]
MTIARPGAPSGARRGTLARMSDFPRTGIVTGASRGMGAVIAEALARRGIALVLAARDAAGLAETEARCAVHGHPVHVVPTDVADPRQLAALVAAAADRLGDVDLLLNNAGVEEVGFFEDLSPEEIELHTRVNLIAPMQLARAVLPGMLARPRPHRQHGVGGGPGADGLRRDLRRHQGRADQLLALAPRQPAGARHPGAGVGDLPRVRRGHRHVRRPAGPVRLPGAGPGRLDPRRRGRARGDPDDRGGPPRDRRQRQADQAAGGGGPHLAALHGLAAGQAQHRPHALADRRGAPRRAQGRRR